jgi:hypothetical protein
MGTAALVLLAALGSRLAAEPPPAGNTPVVKVRQLPGGVPADAALKPTVSIPVAPLGFTPPASFFLGQRNSLVSLDFVDEDRLLFTFRVPGLIRRTAVEGEPSSEQSEIRQIRALVLRLPSGTIDTEAIWTVHDRARYLWMLRDGHFLLRDGNTVEQGDASLDLKPILRLPGPVLWLEIDPEEQFIVTSSREADTGTPQSGQHSSYFIEEPPPPDILLRVVRHETGKVLLESRVGSLTHLAFNSEGYVEALRSHGTTWVLNLNLFTGGSRLLGQVQSTCMPQMDFVAPTRMLATTCGLNGERQLGAILTTGELQWIDQAQSTSVWPVLVRSADGSRLVDETLEATRPIGTTNPLDPDAVRGQAVRVLDAATGDLLLQTAASPVYDAGGNVALSPRGRRLAVLNNGALEIYDLPAPASPAAGPNPQGQSGAR